MKSSWKLLVSFLLVGTLSAGVGAVTYSYMDSRQRQAMASQDFLQNGLRPVNYHNSAENTDFTVAAEQSVHAVVHIKSVAKQSASRGGGGRDFDPFEFFFGSPDYQSQPRVGFGSGVIISSDGYIMTNNHVIDGADELEVTTNDNKTYKAKLIGGDEASDIALLKIEAENLAVIPFGDSDKLKVGEWVLAVGNPFNLTSTVTAGIVSAKGRGNIMPGYGGRGGNAQAKMKVESYIQTDAAVNPGNSGGALVNTRGELVGINTAIYSETGNYAGYSFAVPVSIARKVAADLKQYGAVQRAVLGVEIGSISSLKEVSPEDAAKLKVTEGAYVGGFSFGSPAKAAGIETGDVITAVNDVKIKTPSELQEQISRYNPGEKVKVTIQRGSVEKIVTVELKNRQGGTDIVKSQAPSDLLGATFSNLSDEKKKEYGVGFGIEVASVKNGKLKENGISKGFIILIANDVQIRDVESFEKIIDSVLKQNPDDRGLFIKGFYPDGKMEYRAINLNE